MREAKMRAENANMDKTTASERPRKMRVLVMENAKHGSIRLYRESDMSAGHDVPPKGRFKNRAYFQKSRLATTSSPFSSS